MNDRVRFTQTEMDRSLVHMIASLPLKTYPHEN